MSLIYRISESLARSRWAAGRYKNGFITQYGPTRLLTGYKKSISEHYRYGPVGLLIGVTHQYNRLQYCYLTPIGIPIYPLCELTVNHSIKGFQITHIKIRYSMYVCTNHSFSIIMTFSYANQLSQINQNKPICFSNTFRTNISNFETRIGVDRTNI